MGKCRLNGVFTRNGCNGFGRPAWYLSPQYPQAFLQCFRALRCPWKHTSIADNSNWGRWKYQYALAQQGKLPEDKDLLTEEFDELRHTASRVCDLQVEGKGRKQLRGDTGTHAQMLSLNVGARPAHSSDGELQLVTAQVTKSYLKQPTKCWSDCLYKEVWDTSEEQQHTAHSCKPQSTCLTFISGYMYLWMDGSQWTGCWEVGVPLLSGRTPFLSS